MPELLNRHGTFELSEWTFTPIKHSVEHIGEIAGSKDLGKIGIENVLLHFGYLKYEEKGQSIVGGEEMEDDRVFLVVNKEVEDGFHGLIEEWTREAGTKVGLNELQLGIRRLNIEEIGRCFGRLVTEAASFRDLKRNTQEKAYHLMCLGLLYSTRHDSMVLSQRELGGGYPDLVMHWPVYESGREYTRNAVIFEFKVYARETEDKETLPTKMEQKAMEGLEQIREKNYRGELPAHVWRVAELGICFSGREAPVCKYREWRRDDRRLEWDFVRGEKSIEKAVEEKTS